eukprot:Hpha_TRINITY_DN27123_c0_g1::TRINITY_DN27123_c0_g1_i1::g.29306::m.29306
MVAGEDGAWQEGGEERKVLQAAIERQAATYGAEGVARWLTELALKLRGGRAEPMSPAEQHSVVNSSMVSECFSCDFSRWKQHNTDLFHPMSCDVDRAEAAQATILMSPVPRAAVARRLDVSPSSACTTPVIGGSAASPLASPMACSASPTPRRPPRVSLRQSSRMSPPRSRAFKALPVTPGTPGGLPPSQRIVRRRSGSQQSCPLATALEGLEVTSDWHSRLPTLEALGAAIRAHPFRRNEDMLSRVVAALTMQLSDPKAAVVKHAAVVVVQLCESAGSKVPLAGARTLLRRLLSLVTANAPQSVFHASAASAALSIGEQCRCSPPPVELCTHAALSGGRSTVPIAAVAEAMLAHSAATLCDSVLLIARSDAQCAQFARAELRVPMGQPHTKLVSDFARRRGVAEEDIECLVVRQRDGADDYPHLCEHRDGLLRLAVDAAQALSTDARTRLGVTGAGRLFWRVFLIFPEAAEQGWAGLDSAARAAVLPARPEDVLLPPSFDADAHPRQVRQKSASLPRGERAPLGRLSCVNTMSVNADTRSTPEFGEVPTARRI